MFSNDYIYVIFMSVNSILILFSMLYTFNLQGKDKKFEDGFKALVMMLSSMTFFVVVEWLRNAS